MRRFLISIIVVGSVVVMLAPAQADSDCPGGALGTVPLTDAQKSDLGQIDARFCVVTPPGFSDTKTYPLLVLLHGAGDTFRSWTHKTDAATMAAQHNIVIVTPDGGGTYGNPESEAGWYSDWADGSRKWETFHIQYLMPYVESIYHADPTKVMIAGLSMGGYGAIKYAERHPEIFKVAASFSGAVDTMYGFPVDAAAFSALHSSYGTPDFRVWGDPTQVNSWRANNPNDINNVTNLAHTPIFLASGDGLPIGAHDECMASPPCIGLASNPGALGGYGLEFFIVQMNVSLVSRLDAVGIAHTDNFYPGGSHSWPYWQDDLHWALPQMIASLS